ncbi:hypothetical protein LIP_0501 [Limnochorda pilosa]|uniref:YD repeat-containing protein n=1 Tax=Limnochorda pilosa TaxID=1555112 RepID=A0A0K2SGX1_LIMPI|nr:hypothetical protein LIP_0501 [Limnochorda pilosa]
MVPGLDRRPKLPGRAAAPRTPDANGNVVKRTDEEATVRYTYDSRTQLTRVDFPDRT